MGAALSCFDEDLSEGRRIYKDRLRTVAELRIHEKGLRSLPWWREVREDDQTIMEEVAPPGAVTYRGQPLPPERKDRPPLIKVLGVVEQHLGLPVGRLSGRTRSRMGAFYRCLFCTLAVSWLGFTNMEVTSCLRKGRNSVSRWLSEGHRLQRIDSEFLAKLHVLRALTEVDDGNQELR